MKRKRCLNEGTDDDEKQRTNAQMLVEADAIIMRSVYNSIDRVLTDPLHVRVENAAALWKLLSGPRFRNCCFERAPLHLTIKAGSLMPGLSATALLQDRYSYGRNKRIGDHRNVTFPSTFSTRPMSPTPTRNHAQPLPLHCADPGPWPLMPGHFSPRQLLPASPSRCRRSAHRGRYPPRL